MSEKRPKHPQVAPPAATGNAGPQFEGKVGAFFLLSLLSSSEPRGLPGATIRTVEFQQRGSGRPLDDVFVQATNADGSDAVLEIQAKRTLTFTTSDEEFTDVVAQMWEAAQKPEFETSRYELAVAIARTTTRVEHACQEVLHWARQLPDGATFATHINREKFSSKGMRDFVDVFRVEPCEAVSEVELVRNLLIHDGLLDDMPKGYEVIQGGVAIERFVLMPDRKDGQLERFKNRRLFYGREDKINLRLAGLVRAFQAREVETLKGIRLGLDTSVGG